MSEQGPIGRDGATGAEGRAGTTGREGGEGQRGETGATGLTGSPGPRGRNAAAGFLILLTFCFFGFVRVDQQTDKVEELTNQTIMALRDGCKGLNVIRDNQGRALEDQITSNERTIKGDLGPLERFRDEVEASLKLRKEAATQLRRSVREHPVKGEPFHIDCAKAYP
jgi:hypothetical protein